MKFNTATATILYFYVKHNNLINQLRTTKGLKFLQ